VIDSIRELNILTNSAFRNISIGFCIKNLKKFFVDFLGTYDIPFIKKNIFFVVRFTSFLPTLQITGEYFCCQILKTAT
jgi:hypothetical protein